MSDREPTALLPVRRRLTLLRDGSTATSDMVFCEAEDRSVPVARCGECGFGGHVLRDARRREVSVECSRYTLPSSRSSSGPPPPSGVRLGGAGVANVAAGLSVGISLMRPVVCVAYDASLRVAARALQIEPSGYGVAVVDGTFRLVGILPRATAALAMLRSAEERAVEHMAVDWCSVAERQSLSAVFATMTARRAREVTVVDDERVVVGTLSDIDALRFVAHVSRTGQRPSAERAA